MKAEDIKIVICSNKNDFYLSLICIASIRYFYPDNKIYLVKDFSNGKYGTSQLEKKLNVEILDFGVEKIGWGAAKILFHYNFPPNQKVLFLDSDHYCPVKVFKK